MFVWLLRSTLAPVEEEPVLSFLILTKGVRMGVCDWRTELEQEELLVCGKEIPYIESHTLYRLKNFTEATIKMITSTL